MASSYYSREQLNREARDAARMSVKTYLDHGVRVRGGSVEWDIEVRDGMTRLHVRYLATNGTDIGSPVSTTVLL